MTVITWGPDACHPPWVVTPASESPRTKCFYEGNPVTTRSQFLSFAFMIALGISGCGDSPSSSETGTLSLRLTDAPGDFSEVNITFSEIAAHIDGEWVTVEGEPQTVNLLAWNNGRSVEIGRAELAAGRYTQIRLIIADAEVVVDGATHPMTVPSGAQTGLKFGPAFDVEPNLTFELVIDFDASRSVVATGPPGAPNRYMLQPRIRMEPVATTGAIAGTVSNPANAPFAYALVASDTIASSPVDSLGAFTLAFLPEGTYAVAVVDTAQATGARAGVVVEKGRVTQVGSITLQ